MTILRAASGIAQSGRTSSGKTHPGEKIIATIQVITSDKAKAKKLLDLLTQAGHGVNAGPMDENLRKRLITKPPHAIVINLDRAPATGRDLGLFFRVKKATRHCLLIYVDGKAEKVEAIQALLPDAVYTSSAELISDLSQALAHPPSEPIVPESVFAGYQGRPLSSKIGFKPGMRVALINAPTNIVSKFDPLPKNLMIQTQLKGDPDLTLWFVQTEQALLKQLNGILAAIPDGKLWVVWPKRASKITSDLSQTVVRKHGLDAGWVDFKICSLDDTWTGLCFTARKNNVG
jgi:hypothetical protein